MGDKRCCSRDTYLELVIGTLDEQVPEVKVLWLRLAVPASAVDEALGVTVTVMVATVVVMVVDTVLQPEEAEVAATVEAKVARSDRSVMICMLMMGFAEVLGVC